MTTLASEPRLTVESVQVLRQFQDSLRARIYNLVEDEVRATGNDKVTPAMIEKCILRAIREVAGQHQQEFFPR